MPQPLTTKSIPQTIKSVTSLINPFLFSHPQRRGKYLPIFPLRVYMFKNTRNHQKGCLVHWLGLQKRGRRDVHISLRSLRPAWFLALCVSREPKQSCACGWTMGSLHASSAPSIPPAGMRPLVKNDRFAPFLWAAVAATRLGRAVQGSPRWALGPCLADVRWFVPF